MPEITIKNFKGINFNEGLWPQGYAKYAVGVDLLGLKDNGSFPSTPGVLQCARAMIAGTEAAATNDVTDLIRHFAYYPTTGTVWGLSSESSARLYERTGGAWTKRRDSTDITQSTASGGGLAAHAGSLWITQSGQVARWDNTTWTATFGTFTASTASPRPSKTFAGNLFIGNNRYVSKIDSTPAFTANALTLPADFTIRSMEVFSDLLYIFADNGSFSRLFLWDGTSSTFNSYFDLPDESIAPYLKYSNGILWAISRRAISTPGLPIYVFNGSNFTKLFQLPIVPPVNGDIAAAFRGGLLIASNDSSGTLEDGVAGIWMINKSIGDDSYQSLLGFNPAGGVTTTDIGGIYSSGNDVYVGTNNSSNFQVWELEDSDTNTTGIWQSLPIDAGNPWKKTWHGIQLDSELDKQTFNSSRNIVVKYRVDYDTSFTTLKTITRNTSPNAYMPIGRTGKNIEIRLELGSPASSQSTRIHGFKLHYTPGNQ